MAAAVEVGVAAGGKRGVTGTEGEVRIREGEGNDKEERG